MAAAAFAAEGYKVLNKIKIGGTGGWDYVAVDPRHASRLYASHGSIVEVVDPEAGKVVGQITQLHGVHGIAVAPRTRQGIHHQRPIQQRDHLRSEDAGQDRRARRPARIPTAICYEPKTKRIFTFNGRSNDSTAIDAKTNEIVEHVPARRKAGILRGRMARASSTSTSKTRARSWRSTPPRRRDSRRTRWRRAKARPAWPST